MAINLMKVLSEDVLALKVVKEPSVINVGF